jgi:hypothetical protein
MGSRHGPRPGDPGAVIKATKVGAGARSPGTSAAAAAARNIRLRPRLGAAAEEVDNAHEEVTDEEAGPARVPSQPHTSPYTDVLNSRDWWIISQHKLDKEAVKALKRLAAHSVDAKNTFVDKLLSKLEKGDLRHPSRFCITCSKNAIDSDKPEN